MNNDDLHMIRDDDYDSSVAAAKKIRKTLSRTMRDVYYVLSQYPNGLTDSELRSAMVRHGYPPRAESSYRKRRTELAQLDYVMWAGEHRLNEAGSMERVWTISPRPLPHAQIDNEAAE